MIRLIAGFVIGVVLAGGVAFGQDGANGPSGQSYLKLPEIARLSYVMGFAHGYQSAAVAASHYPDLLRQMQSCMQTMTSAQAETSISQYARANPAEASQPIAVLATRAMLQACGR
ncbi:MAG TPA: hypothetical protein VFU40_01440 [Gemmatimonadales bacterium]|nr:hypothetical protein [Gemmatimonadales bacterium]